MNLLQARSAVMTNLTTRFMLANEITEHAIDNTLNRYYTILAGFLRGHREYFDITTVANQLYYTLNADLMLVERVRYDIDDTASAADYGDDLTEISPREYDDVVEYGIPEEYWLEQPLVRTNARIYFFPVPDTADVTIRVWATTLPDALSSDASNFEFKAMYDLALIQGATKELGAIGEGIPRLDYFIRDYEKNVELIRVFMEGQRPNRAFKTRYREHWQ